jgi:HTH-type transcriptional repressor of NAD biosynthesis genes
MSQQPTISDRLRWLLQTFNIRKTFVFMRLMKRAWSLTRMAGMSGVGIKAFMDEKGIQPNWIYSSEEADAAVP